MLSLRAARAAPYTQRTFPPLLMTDFFSHFNNDLRAQNFIYVFSPEIFSDSLLFHYFSFSFFVLVLVLVVVDCLYFLHVKSITYFPLKIFKLS